MITSAGIVQRTSLDVARLIQDQIRSNFQEAAINREMLSYINDKADFRDLFRDTHAANGLNVIYHALLHNVVLVLSRIFDPIYVTKNRGMDLASLPHLMHLLQDAALRREIADVSRRAVPASHAVKMALSCERSILRAQRMYNEFAVMELAREALAGLRWYRNHHLAHSIFKPRKKDILLYGQIGDLMDAIRPIVITLEGAINKHALEHGWPVAGRHFAHTFWPVVALGMKTRSATLGARQKLRRET